MPVVAISFTRRYHATTTNLRMGPVPTPYPPPNSSGMNTYENQGEGGPPSRTFSGSGSLFLAPSEFCEGCRARQLIPHPFNAFRTFTPNHPGGRGDHGKHRGVPQQFPIPEIASSKTTLRRVLWYLT